MLFEPNLFLFHHLYSKCLFVRVGVSCSHWYVDKCTLYVYTTTGGGKPTDLDITKYDRTCGKGLLVRFALWKSTTAESRTRDFAAYMSW